MFRGSRMLSLIVTALRSGGIQVSAYWFQKFRLRLPFMEMGNASGEHDRGCQAFQAGPGSSLGTFAIPVKVSSVPLRA